MAFDPGHAVVAEMRKTDDGTDEDKQQGDFVVHGSSPSPSLHRSDSAMRCKEHNGVNNTQTWEADASSFAPTFAALTSVAAAA
jgi:hypothetical protein